MLGRARAAAPARFGIAQVSPSPGEFPSSGSVPRGLDGAMAAHVEAGKGGSDGDRRKPLQLGLCYFLSFQSSGPTAQNA
jgi:hypothetical protein